MTRSPLQPKVSRAMVALAALALLMTTLAAASAPLASPPGFQTLATGPAHEAFGSLVADGAGGVLGVVRTTVHPAKDGIYRLDDAGVTRVVAGDVGTRGIALDGAGAILSGETDQVRRRTSAGAEPAAVPMQIYDLGADGDLYGCRLGDVVRAAPDLSWEAVGPRCGWDLAFAPSGEAYVVNLTAIARVDPATGELVPVLALSGIRHVHALAFDAAGDVYLAYQASGSHIARISLATGAWTLVASHPGYSPVTMALDATRLFVTWVHGAGQSFVTGYYALDAPGFLGFRPTFEPAEAPNLLVASVREERAPIATPAGDVENLVDEQRTVVIAVANDGPGDAGAFRVVVSRVGIPFPPDMRVFDVPGIASGASVDLRIPWDTTYAVGSQSFYILVDEANLVVEVDEKDNRAVYRTYVRVDAGPY